MKIKQTLAVAGVLSTFGIAGVAGTHYVSAQDSSTNGQDSLVQKIATKFNLNKNDVQAVFDQDRTDKQAERKKQLETELTKLVSDKKITEDQKQKILAKRGELEKQREANKDSMKNKTDTERKAAMESERASLTQWLKDNGLSEDYAKYVMGGGPGGHGGPRGEGRPDQKTN